MRDCRRWRQSTLTEQAPDVAHRCQSPPSHHLLRSRTGHWPAAAAAAGRRPAPAGPAGAGVGAASRPPLGRLPNRPALATPAPAPAAPPDVSSKRPSLRTADTHSRMRRRFPGGGLGKRFCSQVASHLCAPFSLPPALSAFTSSALNLAIERLFVRQPNSRITPAASVLTSTLCVVNVLRARFCDEAPAARGQRRDRFERLLLPRRRCAPRPWPPRGGRGCDPPPPPARARGSAAATAAAPLSPPPPSCTRGRVLFAPRARGPRPGAHRRPPHPHPSARAAPPATRAPGDVPRRSRHPRPLDPPPLPPSRAARPCGAPPRAARARARRCLPALLLAARARQSPSPPGRSQHPQNQKPNRIRSLIESVK